MGATANIGRIMRNCAVPDRHTKNMKVLYLVANGDLRDAANRAGWERQLEMERRLTRLIVSLRNSARHQYRIIRAHRFDPKLGHGFINSQKMGNRVFRSIPPDAPVIVVETIWQYSHHILGALVSHEGPILTVANWSGTWPGLVGLANLNASLTKHGREYSSLWTEHFHDDFFLNGLKEFLGTGKVSHDMSHTRPFAKVNASGYANVMKPGRALAEHLRHHRAIIGPLDEMCMGMENAVFGNELLYKKGMGKENISQSELLARMGTVSDRDGWAVIKWCMDRGMKFYIGTDEKTELTKRQLIAQGKMYVAAVRIAHKYGLDCIGIQYQQGLKDCCPASDLVEGLLNNPERPDVKCDDRSCADLGKFIRKGDAIPCFNEVDEGCAVDLVLSSRVWKALGMDPSANQEDVRWSRPYTGRIQTVERAA